LPRLHLEKSLIVCQADPISAEIPVGVILDRAFSKSGLFLVPAVALSVLLPHFPRVLLPKAVAKLMQKLRHHLFACLFP
jgi:hypothetical protein